ncbi:MAG: hypothetical protein N3A53_06210 [Verrucomicrobiae bacterium]|nr:hypothetical protein [Verrucomicrobiae bacterium]MCX7915879.1 hypothetical protein [Verrucomicrobiae bacterium]MDW8344955.1 hypothetical protein [Verrucomicrobiae bacterium]
MSTRLQNERKFDRWREPPNGGRRYERYVTGRNGWRARYFKEVDNHEVTVRFWQEIYDDRGTLVEIHEKYPVDTGHRKV